PWGLLLDGDVTGGLVDAVRMCALSFLPVAARLLVLAATLRLIGIPIRAPVDAPWRATDLLDWWRRTHSWRSVVFRTAFLQHLGWAGPAATFGVFLLSGLQHAGAEADPWPHVAVWATLGVLAAINVAWIRVLSKRRVARWMATGVRPEPGRLARLVSLLAVMLVQGLALGLMPALDRGAPAEGAGEP
ncbi:MAG TPA: hypothetical protein PKA64_04860, partial [Myxococcota bacterium]|nr:hypothetical protein [Myxococcota bacterium]